MKLLLFSILLTILNNFIIRKEKKKDIKLNSSEIEKYNTEVR